MIEPYKFVEWEAGSKIKITNPEKFLKEHFKDMNIKENGIYKLHGWAYNLRPFLRKFVYKQYGNWNEIYAPNKTLLRKAVYGRITQIVEVSI